MKTKESKVFTCNFGLLGMIMNNILEIGSTEKGKSVKSKFVKEFRSTSNRWR